MHSLKNAVGPLAALLLAVTAFAAPETGFAQTATNLKCKGCVGKKDLGKKAVKSKHIKNGTIKPRDLADSAKPGGTASAVSSLVFDLTTTDMIVETVTVKAPAAGNVTVFADWYFAGNTTAVSTGRCAITTGSTIGTAHETFATVPIIGQAPTSLHWTFPVNAGNNAFNLICRSDTQNKLAGVVMTGLYTPDNY